MLEEELEYTLLIKKGCQVYEVPPSVRAAGHRAEEWTRLLLRGKVQVTAKGNSCFIKLMSDDDQIFAVCPVNPAKIDQSVERTTDSSRYFVLRVIGPSGQHAFIGMGFEERNDAFDFWACLIDFAERQKAESEPRAEHAAVELNLQFKEGETISLGTSGSRPKPAKSGGGLIKLRPPPS
mmetsp:Transcript_3842/g.8118  ORF Transcript_3842/g.8118 Transcript_3842/m.8118 type:complete len:179 (-) Transcript_3842:43-579(-)